MKPLYRGIAVAAIHCLLVLSVAGKYALDRERLPRAWTKTRNFDPNLPIRGRYVRLSVDVDGPEQAGNTGWTHARLSVRGGRLVAESTASDTGVAITRSGGGPWRIVEPVAFFIPEHVPDPSRTAPDEELWVELSVPRHGGPRPVRLGIRKNGTLRPLDLR